MSNYELVLVSALRHLKLSFHIKGEPRSKMKSTRQGSCLLSVPAASLNSLLSSVVQKTDVLMLTFNFGDNILSSTFRNVLKKLKNVACEQKTSIRNQLVGTVVLILIFLLADF